jgi:hypothetical protein
VTTGPEVRKPPAHYERRLQIFLVDLFRKHVAPWDAVLAMTGNGELRTRETIEVLWRMGLVAGLPDLILIVPKARLHWIEVKLERTLHHDRTELSRDQRETHDLLRWMDHDIDTVRNVDEFWALVDAKRIPHTLEHLPPQQLSFEYRRRRRSPRRQAA